MNKTRSDVIEDLSSTLTYIELVLLGIIMIVICAVTIVGNALVLISFALDKKLRTLNNYFLLSLAVSDVMIATFSMPLFTAYFLIGEWTLGPAVCDMWLSQDYTCSNASVLNLLVIAVDRYCSVTDPLGYRAKKTPKRVAIMIACVWTVSFLLYPPWIYAWPYIDGRRTVPEDDCYIQFLETNTLVTILTSVLDYYVPLAVILALYYRIWKETRRRRRYLADMEGGCYQAESVCLAKLGSSSSQENEFSSKSTVQATYSNGDANDRGIIPKLGQETVEDDAGTALLADVAQNELSAMRGNEAGNRTAEHPHSETSDNDCTLSGRSFLPKASAPQKDDGTKPLNSSCQKNKQELSPKSIHSSYPKGDTDRTNSKSTSDGDKDIETALLAEVSTRGSETDSRIVEHPHSKTSDNSSMFSSQSVHTKSTASQKSASKHDKAARMLTVILLAFIVTSLPYNVTVIIKNLDSSHSLVPDAAWSFFYYLFYINSTLNPLCYALANENFRRTYWRILTCSWNRNSRRTYATGSDSNKSLESKNSNNCNVKHTTSSV